LFKKTLPAPTLEQFNELAPVNPYCLCNYAANLSAVNFVPQFVWSALDAFSAGQRNQCYSIQPVTIMDYIKRDCCFTMIDAVSDFARDFSIPSPILATLAAAQQASDQQATAYRSQFTSTYVSSLFTLIRLTPQLFPVPNNTEFQTQSQLEAIRNWTKNYVAVGSAPFYQFFHEAVPTIYTYYYQACRVSECTWFEPETWYSALLATVAIVSAIHGVVLVTARLLYRLHEKQKWQEDIGDLIRLELERTASQKQTEKETLVISE